MFKQFNYLSNPLPTTTETDGHAFKHSVRHKLHPTTACLMEGARNLMRRMPRIRTTTAVANTMDQSLAGQTIVVTGASSGIGRILTEDCAVRGARVILACRDVKAGQRLVNHILASSNQSASLDVYEVDLRSFESVQDFAQALMEREEKVDVLINNAAVMTEKRKVTEDGHEETMQVNYLSAVMLTILLLDFMTSRSPDPRILFVSSMWHGFAKELFLTDMDWKYFPSFKPNHVYAHSKLALMLFVRELSKRADSRGVRVYAVDPGISLTGITRHVAPDDKMTGKALKLLKPFTRTQKESADSILAVLLFEKYGHTPDVYYFADGKERRCSRAAQNDDKAAELWYLTRELLQLPAMDFLPITSNV